MNRSDIEVGLKIDSICDDFEEAWDANSIVDFETHLQQIDAVHRDKLIAQLIDVDLAMRFNANLTISIEDYSKFGRLATERVQDFLDRKPLKKASDTHPRKIGRYKLEKKIGEGGMGTVFLAQQTEPVKRQVALKLIRAPLASAEIIQRFDAERQALAMMNHPNIAKVLDAGTSEEDMPYFVMEYVEGQNITDYCDSHRIGIRKRLELFVQVCQAIQHAHTKGIIHRDIKPNNVLISLSGKEAVVKVIDFGLAKAVDHTQKLSDKTMQTELGRVIGTVQYMSPEQADLEDRDIDTRTDVYSLGVLLFELLTGSTPLDHKSLNDLALLKILDQIRDKEPPRPSNRLSASGDTIVEVGECRSITPYRLQEILRGELDWIVMKSLEKDRNRRYATADGLSDDVLRFLNDDPVAARPPSAAYRFRKFARRNRVAVATLSVLFAALLMSTTVMLISYNVVSAKNEELIVAKNQAQENEQKAQENAQEARERTDLALKAIESFYTGVSKEAMLKKPELSPLREKFLDSAIELYKELKILLATRQEENDRLVSALVNLAIVSQQSGSLEESKTALSQSLAISEQFVEINPEEPVFQFALATSCQNLGVIELQLGETTQSKVHILRALETYKLLEQLIPNEPKYKHRLAFAYNLLGIVSDRIQLHEEARENYQKSIDQYRNLVSAFPNNPSYKTYLTNALSNLGVWHIQRNDTETATKLVREALAIDESVIAEAKMNSEVPAEVVHRMQFGLIGKLDNFALILSKNGNNKESIATYGKAMKMGKSLVDEYPGSISYRETYAQVLNNLASVFRESGDRDRERKALVDSIEFHESLVKDVPENRDYQRRLAGAKSNLGTLLCLDGDFEAAENICRLAIESLTQLHESDPADAEINIYLATAQKNLAGVYLEEEIWSEAITSYGEAIQFLEKFIDEYPDYEQAKSLLNECNEELGKAEKAIASENGK